jgi:hypothetical protein
MKTSLTAILLAFASYAFSQTEKEIYINWANNKFVIEKGDTSNLQLPFVLRFKEANFNAKELKWKNGSTVISGSSKKFGTDIKLAEGDNGYYQIKFELNEGKVYSNVLGETSLPKKSVSLDVLGKLFTLNYNAPIKAGGDKSDGNNNEEQYSAGYIYYDAMALLSNKIPDSTKLKIYKSYGYEGQPENKYLESFYKLADEGAKKIASQQVSIVGSPFLTNLGNTDVTKFAAGFARFLAERTKDELNEAFFNKMKEQLNAYPELKTAFPKTASFLDIIETYSYASVIQVLKEAFETDVQNLPENLYNIKGLTEGDCDKVVICGEDKDCNSYTNCQARLKKLSEFFTTQNGHWVALGMFSAKEGIQSTNPADLLKSIATSTELKELKSISEDSLKFNDYNVASSIELSNFISQSLISKDDEQVWINSAELKSLINTKDAFEVYLGLLLSFEQRKENKVVINFYKSEKANDTITLGMILIEAKKKYDVYKPQIVSLVKNSYTVYNSTNNAIKKMIAASDKSVEVEPQALYDYYRTLTSSLKPIANSPLLDSLIRKDFGTKYDKIEKYLTPSADLAYHISTKKYSAAIYDASIILTALNELKVTTKDKKGKEKEVKNDGFKSVTKSFVKYGTLISTVASAQSSDEVKNAIEASVLPVGSSSIKRNSNWSISLNAYVGGYWSYQPNQDQIPIMGLSAPIGINFSKGGFNKLFNGFSSSGKWGGLSANIQILDLGALVNYYLLNGDTASIPNDFNVRLSNIFAPGFNVCYNIPKTPLSIAWGGQYIPTLYKYEQINGTNQLTPTNAFRMQFSLLVDIPLYNLKVWDFKK